MKKIIVLAIIALAVTSMAFAEFTVQSVRGSVTREAGAQRVAVRAGEALAEDAIVHTGIGASLVLVDSNGRLITIPAARNGTVAELSRASGLRLGGNVTRVDTAARVGTGNVVTGSARASDAAGDDDIAAE